MNETDLLIAALMKEPDDFTLEAALIEHLECDRDFWRAEAEKKVAEVVMAGRYARDLISATNLLRVSDVRRPYLLGALIGHQFLPVGGGLRVCLEPGERGARFTIEDVKINRRWCRRTVLTVGATRVIRVWWASGLMQGPAFNDEHCEFP